MFAGVIVVGDETVGSLKVSTDHQVILSNYNGFVCLYGVCIGAEVVRGYGNGACGEAIDIRVVGVPKIKFCFDGCSKRCFFVFADCDGLRIFAIALGGHRELNGTAFFRFRAGNIVAK